MATLFSLLSNATLENFIRSVKIREEDKEFLLSQVPNLNLEQRKTLFETLFQIYLLDLQEERTLKLMQTLLGEKREEDKKKREEK